MNANEAREKSEIAREAIAKSKDEYAQKPLNLFQQLWLNDIYRKINRAALKGRIYIILLCPLNLRIKNKLSEEGYVIDRSDGVTSIYW